MDFGANIFGVGALADPAALADVARHAEALGYHSVFVADHVVMPRTLESKYPYSRDGGFPYDPDRNWLDPMVALGYLAARTTTIRLGTSITVLLGASFHDRGRRTDEYLALMRTLWTQENPAYAGQYFQVSDCALTPKPVQKPHVPVWVGGDSEAALRRAARLGDGWHSAGTSLADLPAKLRVLGDALDRAGRSRNEFVVSAFPTDRFTLDVVRRFAAHGVDHVMVPAFSFDADKVRQRLEQIATQVIEPYRRGR